MKDEKIEVVMKSVVKEVVDAKHQSNMKFGMELERKRMKCEAEQGSGVWILAVSMLFVNPNIHNGQGS